MNQGRNQMFEGRHEWWRNDHDPMLWRLDSLSESRCSRQQLQRRQISTDQPRIAALQLESAGIQLTSQQQRRQM